MSSQRNSSQRYGSGALSGSLGRGASGPGGSGPFSKGYGSGLVSLGTTKKPRTASALPERKLSVPRPVNLPSLRKENAGNDPNTQLVPSGGGGGWQKPEQKEEVGQEATPSLTAGSSWASAPSSSGVPSWQPPQPFPVAQAAAPRGRSLNPHEYPSLSAAATAKQPSVAKQPVPHLPSAGSQGGGNWDEDERKPSVGSQPRSTEPRSTGESWADSRFEDDEQPAYRLPWETNGRSEWRGAKPEGGPYGRGYGGDETWRGQQRSARSGFREVEDPTLFPPPPPPRHLPPPPPPPRGTEPSREDTEAEKRAFDEELDRVIAEERRRKEVAEAARVQPADKEPEERVEGFDRVLVRPPPPPPLPPQLTQEEQAAAVEAARQKVLALRKSREAEIIEAERTRREAAAAKLKALEARIAEKQALQRVSQEQQGAEAPPTGSAGTTLQAVEEAAAAAVEASAEGALQSANKVTGGNLVHSASKDSLTGKVASSVEAEASSSVGQDAVGEVDGPGDGRLAALETSEGRFAKSSGMQPKAIWQRKDKDVVARDENAQASIAREDGPLPPHLQPSKDETGASTLFGSSTGFGPALVTTSLGISPDELSATRRPPGRSTGQQTSTALPLTSGQMSWRAALGGGEVPEPRLDDSQKPVDTLPKASEGTGRGRGRGRREREHLVRDDRQGSGMPGGRGEHGRGRHERSRGRGRGRQDIVGIKDDVSIASAGASSLPDSISSTPHEGRRQGSRQPREGRGRIRGARNQAQATPAAPPAVPPQNASGCDGSADGSQTLPPGIPRAAEIVLPPIEATRPVPPPSGGGWSPTGLGPEALPVSQLSLGKPESGLSPKLDPVAPPIASSDSRNDKAIDRPVDRPKSAAGVVGRPKSAASENLLPNGMPVLPNDLSLDGPSESSRGPSQGTASIDFGFNPTQGASGLASGAFPGVFFPQHGAGSSNPWQPAGPGAQSQPNLEAAMQSFFKAAGPSRGGASSGNAFSQAAASQAPSSGLQFGAFGAHTFPQFGQLGTSFGQAPFIPTGKQPDWSTGPFSTPSSSALRPQDAGSSGTPTASFHRGQGMDAIVPSSNIQRRGAQNAPGPPGLQRHAPGPTLFQGANPLPLPPQQQHQQQPPPPQRPPGLKSQSGPQPHFGGLMRGPGSLQSPRGESHNVLMGLPAGGPPPTMQQQQHLSGPPPGIGGHIHAPLPTARDQAAVLPDNVFDSGEVLLMDSGAASNQPAANGQARRSGEGRGRGGGRAAPNRGQGRGRAFGRGAPNQGGRGMPPQLGGPSPIFGNQGAPPGVLPQHSFGPGLVEVQFGGSSNPPGQPQDILLNHGEQLAPGHGPHGPKRGSSGGGGPGSRGKPRMRGERGRGREAKLVNHAGPGQGAAPSQ